MIDALELFARSPLVPVVVINDASAAVPLAEVLLREGVDRMEVTLRTDCALQAIESVARQVPAMTVGVGSVRTTSQVIEAKSAGAAFGVCPGSTQALLLAARDAGLPFVPGAATASEALVLFEKGYRLVKFFPAELAGGIAMLDAWAAPLPELQFFPTGGIDVVLARAYLQRANVLCVGGSWFVPRDRVDAGDFETIARLTHDAMAQIQ